MKKLISLLLALVFLTLSLAGCSDIPKDAKSMATFTFPALIGV